MTDEQMDARLRRAGEAWRSTQGGTRLAEPAEPIDIATHTRTRRVARPGLLLTAAAVAAALAGALAIVITNVGNGGNRTADVAGLENTVWRLVGYDSGQRLPNSFASLVIKNGQLVADDSCDLIGAHVAQTGNQLDVSKLVERFHQCTDAAGEVTFARALDILRAAPTYEIDGKELTITGGGTAMHLTAAPDLPAPTLDVPTLTGTDWQLTKVQDATGATVPLNGHGTLRIDGDRLQASDGCNTLSGKVDDLGQAFGVPQLATTANRCSTVTAPTADVIDPVFLGHVRYKISGAQLTLSRAGAGTLTYQWQPSDASATDPAKLANRTWHLLSVAGEAPQLDLTLRIDDNEQIKGHMYGDDGCHTIWTFASLHAGWLTTQGPLDLLLSTTAPLTPCGTTVHSILSTNPVVWAIRDGKLVIYGGGAQAFALVYGTDPLPGVSSPLVGSTWNEDGSEITGGPSQPTGSSGPFKYQDQLRLDGSGGITITHRCYVNQGSVVIGKDTLDISHVTLKQAIPCPATPDQAAEQQADTNADNVLSGRVNWSIDGELHISKDGSTIDFSR